jgi:hypothetical protein
MHVSANNLYYNGIAMYMEVRMNCSHMLVLLMISMILPTSPLAQEMQIKWTRNAFEAGVQYDPNDQLAEATISCPPYGWAADWLATNVQWSPGTQPENALNDAVHHITPYKGVNRDLVANGTFHIAMPSHTFAADKIDKPPMPITIGVRLHCLDDVTSYTDYPGVQQVTIYDRIPVKSVKTSVPSVVGGQTFDVTVTITSPAPHSSTRVDLDWSGDVDLLVSPPKKIDVPEGHTDMTFKVGTNKTNAANRSVKLSASTKGQAEQTTVTITK